MVEILLDQWFPYEYSYFNSKRILRIIAMVIAAGENELEVAFNKLFKQTLDERARLWIVPGARYVQAFYQTPDQYESEVINFFDQTILQ